MIEMLAGLLLELFELLFYVFSTIAAIVELIVGYISAAIFLLLWIVVSLFVFLLGLGGVLAAFIRRKQRQLIADTPTEDIESVSVGPSEVKGVAEPTTEHGVLSAPFSEGDCLYVDWKIEEYDNEGDSSDWRTKGSDTKFVPFYVNDGTGRLLVEPHEYVTFDVDEEDEPMIELATDETIPHAIREFLYRDDTPGLPAKQSFFAIEFFHAHGDRRYHQHLIEPGDEVYVFGPVQEREDASGPTNEENLVIREGADADEEPMFLISDFEEEELLSKRSFALKSVPLWAAVAGLGAAGLVLFHKLFL